MGGVLLLRVLLTCTTIECVVQFVQTDQRYPHDGHREPFGGMHDREQLCQDRRKE